MIKEKIKEIEQKYDMWADDYNLTPQDIEWLIEQTGRAIKNAEDLHDMDLQLASEQKQNKRYREAILLAFYELGFALDETEIDETKERILQAKLILRNANVLEEMK